MSEDDLIKDEELDPEKTIQNLKNIVEGNTKNVANTNAKLKKLDE